MNSQVAYWTLHSEILKQDNRFIDPKINAHFTLHSRNGKNVNIQNH